jgi:hypothetical protein
MIEAAVNHIGELTDMINVDKWKLAEAIHDAYAEFEPYKQNLTSALCQRCKLSSTQIYNLRNAWSMKLAIPAFMDAPILSVSHYAKVFDLSKIYGLTLDQEIDYLNYAFDGVWSVVQLAQEVEGNHDMKTEEKEKATYRKWLKTMRRVWIFELFGALPKEVRDAYYKLMQVLEAME